MQAAPAVWSGSNRRCAGARLVPPPRDPDLKEEMRMSIERFYQFFFALINSDCHMNQVVVRIAVVLR